MTVDNDNKDRGWDLWTQRNYVVQQKRLQKQQKKKLKNRYYIIAIHFQLIELIYFLFLKYKQTHFA